MRACCVTIASNPPPLFPCSSVPSSQEPEAVIAYLEAEHASIIAAEQLALDNAEEERRARAAEAAAKENFTMRPWTADEVC